MSRDFHTLLAGARGAALLCALVAALVHANTLGNRFAYDDVHILTENEEIQDARNLPRLMLEPYWPGDWGEELGLWRPGTTLALGLQWALWKDRGMPYHLVNVLAHALATAPLVVLLLARLATVPVALLGGLVFAVHPVHVEAVANIVGLAEIQAAVFFLAACLLHLRGGGALARPTACGIGRTLAVTALYLGAFLTKESAVALPGVIFLLDAAREPDRLQGARRVPAPPLDAVRRPGRGRGGGPGGALRGAGEPGPAARSAGRGPAPAGSHSHLDGGRNLDALRAPHGVPARSVRGLQPRSAADRA